MRIGTCLVLVLTLVGIGHCWLTVPHWIHREAWVHHEKPERTGGIPEKVEEPLDDFTKHLIVFKLSPHWRSLSQKQRKILEQIFMAMKQGPKFSPFGG